MNAKLKNWPKLTKLNLVFEYSCATIQEFDHIYIINRLKADYPEADECLSISIQHFVVLLYKKVPQLYHKNEVESYMLINKFIILKYGFGCGSQYLLSLIKLAK